MFSKQSLEEVPILQKMMPKMMKSMVKMTPQQRMKLNQDLGKRGDIGRAHISRILSKRRKKESAQYMSPKSTFSPPSLLTRRRGRSEGCDILRGTPDI